MKYKIGIMQGRLVRREIKSRLQSFPWKNWRNEIMLAKKYKINFIEWTLDYKDFYKNPLIKYPFLVKKILNKNNIKTESVTCDFFMQRPPFHKKKYKTTEFLLKLISVSRVVGIKYIVIPLVDNSSLKNIKNKKKIISYFKQFQKINKSNKVKIIFEFDLKPKKVIQFINKLDNSFGINYDLGNSAFYRHKFEEEKKYFYRVFNIHLKDRNRAGQSVLFGKGLVKFHEFFKFLNKIKYKNLLILQSFIPSNNNVVINTMQNYKFIKKIYEKK